MRRFGLWLALFVCLTGRWPALADSTARTLRIQTGLLAGDPALWHLANRAAPMLEAMSSGLVKVEILALNAAVPHSQTLEAVAEGLVDGGLTFVSAYAGKNPGYALLGDLGILRQNAEIAEAFCMQGGGRELLQTLHDKHAAGAVQVIGCTAYARDMLLATKPVAGLQQIKDVRVAMSDGLFAEALKRMGAVGAGAQGSLADMLKGTGVAAVVVDALAANRLDGARLSTLHTVPLGYRPLPVVEFIISRKTWATLSPAQHAMVESWFRATFGELRQKAELEERYFEAQRAAAELSHAETIRWTREDQGKAQTLVNQTWAELAKKTPLAKEVSATLLRFLTVYGLPRPDLGAQ